LALRDCSRYDIEGNLETRRAVLKNAVEGEKSDVANAGSVTENKESLQGVKKLEQMGETTNPIYPWSLVYVPNPIFAVFCDSFLKTEKDKYNTFKCFSQIQAYYDFVDNLNADLIKPTTDSWREDLKKNLYKVVVISTPKNKWVDEKSTKKSFPEYAAKDFKCMGYVSTTGPWRESLFHDRNLRFNHEGWTWDIQHQDRDDINGHWWVPRQYSILQRQTKKKVGTAK